MSLLDIAKSQLTWAAQKAKAVALKVSDVELKVLEATNHDSWGPHGQTMSDIAQLSYDPQHYREIMGIIDQRLAESPENWRLVYKALLLLEFMSKHGPFRVVDTVRASQATLEYLRDRFEYKDTSGKDCGINVRQRARELHALVLDDERIKQERDKAVKNANKYKGVSSSDAKFAGFGSTSGGFGSASSNYGSPGGYSSTGSISSSARHGSAGLDSTSTGPRSTLYYSSAAPSGSIASAANPPEPKRTSSSSADLADDDGDDPVEATRRRIERLKAEGALPAPGSPSAAVDLAEEAKRVPKKLTDIKVNPAIMATFASFPTASPTAASTMAATGAAPKATAVPAFDLLADLDAPAPAAPAALAGGSDWDAFTAAPVRAASPDAWSEFAAAPPPAAPAPAPALRPALALDDLLGGPAPAAVLAPQPAAVQQPVFDAFGSFTAAPAPVSAMPVAAAAPAPAAFDPFAAFAAAPAPATAGFGFAPPAAAPAAGAMAKPKLSSETAAAARAAKDPFADLALL